jgi:hypothetical protein
MQWLTLAYFLSLGTVAYQGQTFDLRGSAMFIVPQNSFQTTLGVEAQLFDNHAFAGASVETWETHAGSVSFAPSEAFYIFNAGLRAWGFELGWRHECDHPVSSNWGGGVPQGMLSMRDEFYISYTGKINVF